MQTGDAIQEVMSRLTIDDVGHQNSTFSIAEDFQPDVEDGHDIGIQLRTAYSNCVVDDLFEINEGRLCRYRFFYELGVRVLDSGSDEGEDSGLAVIATISARMYSQYVEVRDSDTAEIDADVLQEFGEANALYHVWPYWREYVQSTMVRLKLPAISIPMFRLPKENWKQKPSGGAD